MLIANLRSTPAVATGQLSAAGVEGGRLWRRGSKPSDEKRREVLERVGRGESDDIGPRRATRRFVCPGQRGPPTRSEPSAQGLFAPRQVLP